MIKLTLNGQPVALFPDTKIGITAMNPYFNEIGAFSYPFTIPYIPNMEILKHAARIQNVTRTFIWDAVLMVNGVELMRGEAIAEGDVQNDAFPIVLRSAKTSFIKLAETKKLQDLEFGIENTDTLTAENVIARRTGTLYQKYGESNYVCAPFYNNKAWTDQEREWVIPDYINAFDPNTSLLVDLADGKSNSITYNFYVRYILKRIIELLGLTLESDDMSTIQDLNRWFLLSFNNAWGKYNTNYQFSFSQINVRDFLKVIRQFGIVIVTNDRLRTASIRLVRDVFRSPSLSRLLNSNALKEIPIMSTPKDGYTIGYADSTSDLIVSPIDKPLILHSLISKILITVAKYSDIPIASSITTEFVYLTTSTGRYYVTILQEKENSGSPNVYKWENVANYQPFVSGGGEEKISIDVTVAGQRQETRTVTKSITITGPQTITKTWDINIEMPEINQKMNNLIDIWYNGSKYEDTPLVFLFNWGMKVYANDEDPRVSVFYPVISADAYGLDEVDRGSISMRTSGAKSIIEQLAKDEQDWMIRRKQKRQSFILSVLDYANFNWGEIQNISSVNYLVNSLKFDIGINGISPVEADLYTV
ncbi:MAG TPA: hypothetical protein VFC67_25180 [Prolixibacteraceae bacterium]|nr:hypothetical protein [Prolixibacteraceae bacterium]